MSNSEGSVKVEHRQDGWVVTLELTPEGIAKLQHKGRVQIFNSDTDAFRHDKHGNLFTVKEVVCKPST